MALDPTLLIGLKALGPYVDDMVIAGGWVPYLYAAHERPSGEAVALKTRDLDVAVPREVPEREKPIDQLTGIIVLAHALLSSSTHLGTRPTFIIGIVLVVLGLPFLVAALRSHGEAR